MPFPLFVVHKHARRYFEGSGNLMNVEQADIPFAPLHSTDVCAIKTTRKRQRFLRKTLLFSQFPHPNSKVLLDLRVASLAHGEHGTIMDDNKSTDFTYLY